MPPPTDFSGLIGIDLGTTFSCAARLSREGVPQTIPNREGELITPSVVVVEDEMVIVGREAKRSECVYPDRTAVCVKRDMGVDRYSRALGGKLYRPEILSAMILKRIKTDKLTQIREEFRRQPTRSNTQYGWVWIEDGRQPTVPVGA